MSERNSLEISRWASFFLTAVWQLQSLKHDRFDNMHSRHRCKNRQCSVGHWVERWTEPFSWTFWLNWAGQECVTPAKLTMKLPTPFGCPFFVLVWVSTPLLVGTCHVLFEAKGVWYWPFWFAPEMRHAPQNSKRISPCWAMQIATCKEKLEMDKKGGLKLEASTEKADPANDRNRRQKIHRSWHVGGWTW